MVDITSSIATLNVLRILDDIDIYNVLSYMERVHKMKLDTAP